MLGGIIGLCLLDYRLTILVRLFLPIKAFMMSFFARKRKEQMDFYIQQEQSRSRWFGSTVGAVLIMREELTIGTVFAFISYSVYVTAPISAILDVGFFLSGIIPSTKRFFGLITEEAKMSYFKYQTRLPAAR